MNAIFDRLLLAIKRRLSGGDSRILIAGNHAGPADGLTKSLGDCGFRVKVALDGRLVLAMAREFRPHFILLDIIMPGVNGYEIAAMLRKDARFRGTVIIGFSAYQHAALQGPRMAAHFDHCVTKPFDLDMLLEIIRPS